VPPGFGVVEFGCVVAPDLAEAPEPTSLSLAALGVALLAAAISSRRFSAPALA
jgi:hypothetical protein